MYRTLIVNIQRSVCVGVRCIDKVVEISLRDMKFEDLLRYCETNDWEIVGAVPLVSKAYDAYDRTYIFKAKINLGG